VAYLKTHASQLDFDVAEVIRAVHNNGQAQPHNHGHQHGGGGCPGSKAISFEPESLSVDNSGMVSGQSQLRQWPVQMHLVNPTAPYFRNADVLLAADCVAFSMGSFHEKFLKGKGLAIGCPKLDEGLDTYTEKIRRMIDEAQINTLTVMIMEVPCCSGLLQLARNAASLAQRKVPVKAIVVSLKGEILQEEWI
jgi:hypothetical protein